jgi:hypothetical protein
VANDKHPPITITPRRAIVNSKPRQYGSSSFFILRLIYSTDGKMVVSTLSICCRTSDRSVCIQSNMKTPYARISTVRLVSRADNSGLKTFGIVA